MAIRESSDRSDVVESSFDHVTLTVGTTPVEVKVGGSRSVSRQIVVIYNEEKNRRLFWGKSDVSATGVNRGFPIEPGQFVSLPFGDIGIFLVGEVSNMTAIIAEVG